MSRIASKAAFVGRGRRFIFPIHVLRPGAQPLLNKDARARSKQVQQKRKVIVLEMQHVADQGEPAGHTQMRPVDDLARDDLRVGLAPDHHLQLL